MKGRCEGKVKSDEAAVGIAHEPRERFGRRDARDRLLHVEVHAAALRVEERARRHRVVVRAPLGRRPARAQRTHLLVQNGEASGWQAGRSMLWWVHFEPAWSPPTGARRRVKREGVNAPQL